MRRLTLHVLAAAGVSVLTAGAAVGSLTSSTIPADSSVVAVPAVAPAPGTSSTSDLDRRAQRESRGAERTELPTSFVAERQRALAQQRTARAKQQSELKKQQAAAQKRAEQAKQRAERARQRAAQKRAAAAAKIKAEAKARAKAKAAAGTKAKGYSSGDSPKTVARKLMQNKYGWGASQFSCYNNIIMRESVWKVHADNPTSSAYGIPQALPGRKMASAGPDWRNNPATQIKWGLGYVKDRYGTPCKAWSFKRSHGWY